jgi:hypothetical protein
MSGWTIYSKQGTPKYKVENLEFRDIWMGEEFVTVSIVSPTPIELQIGDYLTYRGATYTIYSLPAALKQARSSSYGEAFKYDNVKLSARSTELTDIRFLDIVLGDNNLHYTSLPTFSVYCETVDDLVDRLQANTDRNAIQWFFITPNHSRTMQRYTGAAAVTADALWHQYYDDADDLFEGNTEINVSVDKKSLWEGLAFIKNNFGLNFITRDRSCIIGAPGVIANHIFQYGKGNGLYQIERVADQDQQIVTKLFAYGSDKNLPLRYYATIGDDMPNNMAVNVLMLPGFPQYALNQLCRTTYYTDGTGKRHTKVQIRKTPSAGYSDIMDILGEYTIGFSDNKLRPYITSGNVGTLGVKEGDIHFTEENDDNGLKEVYPSIEGMTAGDAGVSGLPADERLDEIKACDVIDDNGVFEEGAEIPNFNIYLKPLGFDLKQAYDANGGTMVIHLNDGYCGGRDFSVKSVEWEEANSRWKLNVERHHDESLDLYFPYSWGKSTGGSSSANEAYQIRTGDHFVLTEIEISDTSYIWAASVKALRKAITWLLNNDYTRFTYLPKVDEIFMARQHDSSTPGTSLHDTLKAGDVMNFEDSDLDIAGNVFIDTLTIKENGNNGIPTYDVVLRNDKQVGTMQRIQNQLNSLSSFVSGGGGGLSIAQIRQLIQTYGADLFLSKLNDDTAQGTLTLMKRLVVGLQATFNKGFESKDYSKLAEGADFGDFVQGLVGGDGARIDKNGNMEATSLFLRSELIAPKLTYNHVDVRVGDEWQTNGGGEIAYVDGFFTDPEDNIEGGYIHLRLQEDDEGNIVEFGTLKLNDFCKGIFHNMDGGYNDTQTTDDGKGGRTFSGFFTSFFNIIEVSGDHYETLKYKLRPTITSGGFDYWMRDDGTASGMRGGFHPCAHMTFAQYSNPQDTTRQNCQYRTTTYMRMLANMTGWDEGLANVAFQVGNTPLIASAFGSTDPSGRAANAGRYSMWINGDIFFSGTLNRVDAWGRDITDYPDQGDYAPTTTYRLNDLVHYNGIVWRCIKASVTGEAPGSNTQDPSWIKWIYAESVEPMGHWNSTRRHYPAKAIVNLFNGVYMAKTETNNAPLGLLMTKDGEYITTDDGGYIIVDDTIDSDWELLLDTGDITNGEDGENAVVINLTNDTDSVLTDEKGNIPSRTSFPTTTAELYDGLNKVVQGVVWSIQSTTGCTASIDATTGECQVLTMTADNAEVVIIATYKQKTYGKKFTFKKLLGKDKLWLDMPEVVYYDNPTAKNISPVKLVIRAYITSATKGTAQAIYGSMNCGYVRVGGSNTNYYHGDEVGITYDSFTNGHLIVNLYDSSGNIQDTEDIRLLQEPTQLVSGGRWTSTTEVKINHFYRFGDSIYLAKKESVGISPVMSLLKDCDGNFITTSDGGYIILDDRTNTEYYDKWVTDGDAVNAVRIDLDNENDTMLYDNNGNLLSTPCVSNATLYEGNQKISNAVFSIISTEGCTAAINGNKITVSAMSQETGSVMVGCVYKGTQYIVVMSLTRIINQDKFDIVCSPNSVAYNSTSEEVQTGGTIVVEVWRTPASGGAREKVQSLATYGLTLSCSPSGIMGTYSGGSATITVNASTAGGNDNIIIILTKDGKTVDAEGIPIVKAEDAVTYEIVVFPDGFNRNNDGTYKDSTHTITCRVFKIAGETRTELNNTTFASEGLSFAPLVNDTLISNPFQWSGTAFYWQLPVVYPSGSSTLVKKISVQVKKSNAVILSKDITFSFDGKEGLQGCATRVSEWNGESGYYRNDEGKNLQSGEVGYIDIVARESTETPDGYYFYLLIAGSYSGDTYHSTTPPENDTSHWLQLSNVGPLYTSLLIAKNAFIKFGSGNQFIIINSSNNIEAGMKGDGDIRIWAGGSNIGTANDTNLANAPYRVKKDGSFVSSKADIQGTIRAQTYFYDVQTLALPNSDGQYVGTIQTGKQIVFVKSPRNPNGQNNIVYLPYANTNNGAVIDIYCYPNLGVSSSNQGILIEPQPVSGQTITDPYTGESLDYVALEISHKARFYCNGNTWIWLERNINTSQ